MLKVFDGLFEGLERIVKALQGGLKSLLKAFPEFFSSEGLYKVFWERFKDTYNVF